MAQKRDVNVDLQLEGLEKIKAFKDGFKAIDTNIGGTKLKITELKKEVSALYAELQNVNTSLASVGGYKGAVRTLQTGTPQAGLINAGVQGQLNAQAALAENVSARLTNGQLSNYRKLVRGIESETINSLVRMKAGQFGKFLPTNTTESRNYLEAAEIRAAQSGLRLSSSPNERNEGRFKADLERLERARTINSELVGLQEKQNSLARATEGFNTRIARAQEKVLVATMVGNQLETINAKIKVQRLIVEKESLLASGQKTVALTKERDTLAQLIMDQRRLKNEIRLTNLERDRNTIRPVTQAQRQNKLDSVIGDGGATLFKIQTQLYANFLLTNQFFNLINFGRTFVVELNRAMYDLQAVTATTSYEMSGLSKELIKISEGTKFTAVQVAQASVLLGQAGFSAQQITKAIGPITLFATAVGADLTKAVDTVTSTMSIFNMRAEDAGHVANVLTGAINQTKLTVDKLSLGLQFAGNTAAQAGIGFEELVSVIGAFANSGVRSGSILGTGLSQMIVSLMNPTEKMIGELKKLGLSLNDIDIQSNGLTPVLKTLSQAGFGAANAFEGMEIRAARAYLSIKNQLNVVDQLQQSLLLSNAAVEANARQMESLGNKTDQFTSILGTSILHLSGPFVEALKLSITGIGAVLQLMNQFPTVLSVVGTGVLSLGIAFAGLKLVALYQGLRAGAAGFSLLGASSQGAATGVAILGTSLKLAFPPLLLLTAAIAAGIGIFSLFSGAAKNSGAALDEATGKFNQAKGEFDATSDAIESVDQKITELTSKYYRLSNSQSEVDTQVIEARIKFGALGLELDSGRRTVDELVESLVKLGDRLKSIQGVKLDATIAQLREVVRLQGEVAAEEAGSVINALRSSLRTLSPERAKQVGLSQVLDIEKTLNAAKGIDSSTPEGLEELRNTYEEAGVKTDRLTSEIGKLLTVLNAGGKETLFELGITSEKGKENLIQVLSGVLSQLGGLSGQINASQAKTIELGIRNQQSQDINIKDTAAYKELEGFSRKINQINSNVSGSLSSLDEFGQPRQYSTSDRKGIIDENHAALIELKKEAREKLQGRPGELAAEMVATALSNLAGTLDKNEASNNADIRSQASALRDKAKSDFANLDYFAPVSKTEREYLNKTQAARAALHTQLEQDLRLFDASEENVKLRQYSLAEYQAKRATVIQDYGRQFVELDKKYLSQQVTLIETMVNLQLATGGFTTSLQDTALAIQESKARLDIATASLDGTIAGAGSRTGKNFFSVNQIENLNREKDGLALNNTKESIGPLKQRQESLTEYLRAYQELSQRQLEINREIYENENLSYDERITAANNILNIEKTQADKRLELLGITKELAAAEGELAAAQGISGRESKNFSEELSSAIENYKEKIGANQSLIVQYGNLLPQAFDNATSSLGTFFYDAATGTKSLSEAFKDMTKSILSSLAQIASTKAAEQLFGLGLSLFSGTRSIQGSFIRAAGGFGVGNRDSVPILAQPGEFLLRKSAVDAVGRDTLDHINALGNRRISKSSAMIAGAAGQRPGSMSATNVWVVAPEERPAGLGPNDVIAVMGKDILEKGQTRQLIKRVIAGTL